MDGVLDLHTFQPRDIGGLVPDWLAACQERGLLELRIIHGKGIGNLRRTVHAILSRHPQVERFSLAGPLYGGTGATIVHLRPPARAKG
jgi:DNA-nicking Smr family endonuclease